MIDDIADLISRLLTVFMIGSLILFTGAYTVDSFTVEQTGNESVPCLDEMYRPFENQLCTKKTTCSKLGIAGDRKCINIKHKEELAQNKYFTPDLNSTTHNK